MDGREQVLPRRQIEGLEDGLVARTLTHGHEQVEHDIAREVDTVSDPLALQIRNISSRRAKQQRAEAVRNDPVHFLWLLPAVEARTRLYMGDQHA